MAKQYEELEARVKDLETKMVQLMADVKKSSKPRKVRQLTDEQRAAIRARLIAGQEAARKQRENIADHSPDQTEVSKIEKSKNGKGANSDKAKPTEIQNPAKN